MSLSNLKRRLVSTLGNIQIWPSPPFITFSPTSYKLSGRASRIFSDTVLPGDVILRRYDRYLTSLMVPGFYSHVGIAVSKTRVVHAIGGEGVIEEDLLQFLRTDHACILRPRTGADVKKYAIKYAVSNLGLPYDILFYSKDSSALYCTELITKSYRSIVPKEVLNKDRVPPDDLLELQIFEKVLSTDDISQESKKA